MWDFGVSVLYSSFPSQRMDKNLYHPGTMFRVRRAANLLGIMKYFHSRAIEAAQEEIICWREMTTRGGGWDWQHMNDSLVQLLAVCENEVACSVPQIYGTSFPKSGDKEMIMTTATEPGFQLGCLVFGQT